MSIDTYCVACRRRWRIHRSLSGYRLRCECGAWIDLSGIDEAGDGGDGAKPVGELHAGGAVERPLVIGCGSEEATARSSSDVAPVERRGDQEMLPARGEDLRSASLREAGLRERRKWTDRTILELAAMALAFWLPALVVEIGLSGRARALALPFAGIVAGALVLLVGWAAGGGAFAGLRRASARHFDEAALVAAVTVAIGMAWTSLLDELLGGRSESWLAPIVDELGVGWTLVVIALLPAIFEELAFRGLLQGRLTALLGARQGILITGMAFGLAHGMTLGLPIQAGLGFYLCWLRWRSRSLLPGMLTHFLHNAGIVLLTVSDLL